MPYNVSSKHVLMIAQWFIAPFKSTTHSIYSVIDILNERWELFLSKTSLN